MSSHRSAPQGTQEPLPELPAADPARRVPVIENQFGRAVADPYRWLEQGESEEVRSWTQAQNQRTRSLLARESSYDAIRQRLAELLAVGSVGVPIVRRVALGRMRYFFTRRSQGQNQPALYVREGQGQADRVVLDPNTLASDGTVAIDWWAPSNDGRLVVYGLSHGGDEESVLHVRNAETGVDLPDRIARTRLASIAWLPDSSGFYYTRFPTPGTVPVGEESYHRTVYLHHLGDDSANDPVVFSCADMTDSPGVEMSPNGRWLLVIVYKGWTRSELHLRDMQGAGGFSLITAGLDAIFAPTLLDDVLYVRTNDGASRYRLFAVDLLNPGRASWQVVVDERSDVLQSIAVVGADLLVTYLSDASSRICHFGRDGSTRPDLPLPMLGASSGVSGLWDGNEAFYDFSSFTVPPAIYRVDLTTGEAAIWETVPASIEPCAFEIERVRATSKDGTLVPMFIVHKRGVERTGSSPTVLMGYGGFGISMLPTFNRASCLLLERGGVLAVANLRGGGEFGEEWHRAGMLESKQNVFDDAIACAQWLIDQRFTDTRHLGIMGGSNGGLLVGAIVVQRPDLLRAAVCSVPLLDMLRYHRFRIAKLWIREYGSPDDPTQFEWLYAYSPYHHVRPGTSYPALLFTTAEGDSRVDPLHARKMTAALQAATSSSYPVLLRVENKAGHGAGKPIAKLLDELTDVYTFLFAQLGVGPEARNGAS